MEKKYKIIVTGGSGRFGSVLKKVKTKNKILFPKKKNFDILKINSLKQYLKINKPDIIIHLAGLSRPMELHDKNIIQSIKLNIIGTSNLVLAALPQNIKIIYFSTNYVYPSTKGNYSEKSPVFPINNYAWSKLGGETAVQMYKNSLILRVCMTENPFIHKKAFYDVKTNFIFHKDVAKILFRILKFRGIFNVGGKIQSIYNFAKKNNARIKKISKNTNHLFRSYPNPSMNISKLDKILKSN
jgi:dTDP-4-dehydrorhamnose reductase